MSLAPSSLTAGFARLIESLVAGGCDLLRWHAPGVLTVRALMWGAATYCHFERSKGLNALLGALSIIGRNNTQKHYSQKHQRQGIFCWMIPISGVPQEYSRSEGSPPLIKGLVFIALAEALNLLIKPGRPAAVDAGFDSPQSVDEPLRVHLARAKEAGRGREASSPTEIPWRN
jgi:hypothetical protein